MLACFIVNQMFILYFERGIINGHHFRPLKRSVVVVDVPPTYHHHITEMKERDFFDLVIKSTESQSNGNQLSLRHFCDSRAQRYTRYARDAADFNLNSILDEGRSTGLCKSCNRYNSYTMLKVRQNGQ